MGISFSYFLEGTSVHFVNRAPTLLNVTRDGVGPFIVIVYFDALERLVARAIIVRVQICNGLWPFLGNI